MEADKKQMEIESTSQERTGCRRNSRWASTLTHSFPMHLFSTPWKHQKIVRFSDVSRG